MADVERLHKQL
jgi:hypothetical protein